MILKKINISKYDDTHDKLFRQIFKKKTY